LGERERLARDLGTDSRALVLRNHGLLTLGRSVREAFEFMYYLDRACQIQVDAMAGGMDNLLLITREVQSAAHRSFNRPNRPAETKEWPALLRLLESNGSNYAS
jgi:ribulose-5-phosphate 4-epimerase/fuculose-1-phosphate aldolase